MAAKLEHFLLCEDASVDYNGLLSLHRLLPSEMQWSGPGAIPKLVSVLMFSGMKGIPRVRYKSVQLKFGEQLAPLLAQTDWIPRQAPDAKDHTFLHQMSPFLFPVAGPYQLKFTIEFEGKTAAATTTGSYAHSFEVTFQQPGAMPPASPSIPPQPGTH